jgi:threonine aldolase
MIIDLRSDTVSKPNKAMLEAMTNAPVGDDVFAEDETVKKLEERVASMFGMEAGLYCPSGTMSNQIAIKAHTQPLDEIICDQLAHIYNYETGGWAFHSGVSIKLIPTERGIILPHEVEACIQPDFDWLPNSSLLCIENTVNRGGGSAYTLEEMKALKPVCEKYQLKYHLDGARIFNALIAKNYSTTDLSGIFDSISICFSKGLGAPIGSILIGEKSFIKKSRKIRKVMGGGMRQAGYLASACLYALDNNVNRLAEDHTHAQMLADALSKNTLVSSIRNVETNIVIFSMIDKNITDRFVTYLADNNIKAVPFGGNSIRFVTHIDISREMIEKSIELIAAFV